MKHILSTIRQKTRAAFARAVPLATLGLMAGTASAADAGINTAMTSWSNVSVSGNTGATTMINQTGGALGGVVGLIMGPGFYIALGVGAIMVLIGWFKGNKEILYIGIGGFILAAIIRGAMMMFA